MDAHARDKCPGRMVECEHCHGSHAARAASEHAEQCAMRGVKCQHCKSVVAAWKLPLHEAQLCDSRPVITNMS